MRKPQTTADKTKKDNAETIMAQVRLDEIGDWSEIKLSILREYKKAYSTIIAAQPEIRKHIYIDGFSGPGVHISKRTGGYVRGSPLNALSVEPPFDEFHFIDLDGDKANLLRSVVEDLRNVYVYEGDCNDILLQKVFPRAKYTDYHRALCFLDPYKMDPNWKIVQAAGQMRSIEIFLNFFVMDMNRNVLWRNPEKVDTSQLERMNAFWGDDSWHNVAYTKSKGLFGDIEEKTSIEDIVKAYQERLEKVARFSYVPDPIPMRNSKGAIVYYLFFASPNRTGAKIVKWIFDKYRSKGAI
ncbi:MAG: three-Cys-motif partner protein TcmP [Planctomycetota bacterium]